MNKFKNSIVRYFAGLVMAAMVAVPSVHALTLSDVELLISLGIIPADKATAARAAVSGNQTGNVCGAFTRDLTLGSTGSDVVALQTFLESRGMLVMPVGVAKGYFGTITRSALARYQASVGISPAAGYFGPITRSDVSSKCTPTTPTPPPTTDPDQELRGGEASIRNYTTLSTYSNEDLEEGESGKVFASRFRVEDGDIRIERVSVRLEAVSQNNEDEPWKHIESMDLYVGGRRVASADVDSQSDWSRGESTDNSVAGTRSYEMRFSNLREVIERGSNGEIEILVQTSDRIDNSDLPQRWKVWIPRDGIRALDARNVQHYIGSDSDSRFFNIENAGDGEVRIRESDRDLDPTILIVDSSSRSPSYEVFRFVVDNTDNADVLLNTMTLVASTSHNNIQNVISDLSVRIGGKNYQYDNASTTSNLGEYLFDFEDNNDQISIDRNERVEVVVSARFNRLNGNYPDGTQIQFGIGRINGDNYGTEFGIEAEGESTGDRSTISGRQEGSVHTLRTQGVNVTTTSRGTFVYRENTSSTLSDDEGEYRFTVRVTAFEEDAWIENSVSVTASSTVGFVTEITGDAFSGISNARIADTSARTLTNNRYRIPEGATETFEIVVRLDPDARGAFGLRLTDINFADSSTGTPTSYVVPNTQEFRIPTYTIQN